MSAYDPEQTFVTLFAEILYLIAGRRRGLMPTMKRELKRRSAI